MSFLASAHRLIPPQLREYSNLAGLCVLPRSVSTNNFDTGITNLDQKPPKAVTELIAIMEEQVEWEWKKMFEEDRLTSPRYTQLFKQNENFLLEKPLDL